MVSMNLKCLCVSNFKTSVCLQLGWNRSHTKCGFAHSKDAKKDMSSLTICINIANGL